jgi:phosphate transport system protein
MQHLDLELSALKEKLLTMASNSELAVINAVKALVERNDDLAREVKEKDRVVDQLEKEVDEMAVQLLSKAPLASDLRFIIVATKIAQNLERVADEATTIARRTLELNQEPQLKPFLDIPKMAEMAVSMLKDALDAFVNRQSDRARSNIPRDKEVDAIHRQLQRELASFMVENPKNISRCLNLMVISKSIERIADHATNIAEEVVYLCEAADIRYEGKLK